MILQNYLFSEFAYKLYIAFDVLMMVGAIAIAIIGINLIRGKYDD